jgi:leucyl/phenylalanyl-tRNA--protein transferase
MSDANMPEADLPETDLFEIILGYANGYFLMDNGDGLRWYSSKRHALIPLDDHFHLPGSLRRILKAGQFEVRINTNFAGVIAGCRSGGNKPRDGQWISAELELIYHALHRAGVAQSFEVWQHGALAGGILGLAIGGAFIGESMFHHVSNASKVALVKLVEHLRSRGFMLFDAQVQNPHLARFGTFEVGEREYRTMLEKAVKLEVRFQ